MCFETSLSEHCGEFFCPCSCLWRMIACAHGTTTSVSFFRKGAVGSHGLYLVNPTRLQSTQPHRTSLFAGPDRGPVCIYWWKGTLQRLATAWQPLEAINISRHLMSTWRNLKFGAADMKIAFRHICFMSRGLHEALSCKLCFVLKAKNTDFHFVSDYVG